MKMKYEINFKVDTGNVLSAIKKATEALQDFEKAIEELRKSKINLIEVKPKKW